MTIQFGFFAGALELCLVTDLVEIGVPRSAAEQITIHFGNALPRGEEHEPSSELTLPELEQPVELEVVELAEPELELDLREPEPEAETEVPILDLHGGGRGAAPATTEEGVHALLVAKKLEQCADAMAEQPEQGYYFVDDLVEADGEELAQLAKDVQMKTPEARRFRKTVAAARKSAGWR